MLKKIVAARGQDLRTLTYERLLTLDRPRENIEIHRRRGVIEVILEPCSDQRVRIVVRGSLNRSLFGLVLYTTVALDGFYKQINNSVVPMKHEEFYDYD